MAYTTSSTLGELIADPQIVAIIEKYVPGSTEDPNMKNGGKVKISTFLKFPQAGKKASRLKSWTRSSKKPTLCRDLAAPMEHRAGAFRAGPLFQPHYGLQLYCLDLYCIDRQHL